MGVCAVESGRSNLRLATILKAEISGEGDAQKRPENKKLNRVFWAIRRTFGVMLLQYMRIEKKNCDNVTYFGC